MDRARDDAVGIDDGADDGVEGQLDHRSGPPTAGHGRPGLDIDEASAQAELHAAITRDGLRLDITEGRLAQYYEIGKPIGKGKFSTVFKASRKIDGVATVGGPHVLAGTPVALKQIAIFDIMDARSREKCLKEIRLVQSLDHPNIIRYLDGFFENKQLVLIFEYAEAGER